MHMNDQMCYESWSRMLDEASKERQMGGGKEPELDERLRSHERPAMKQQQAIGMLQ